MNGKLMSIRVRVDNLTLKQNGAFDINEAKFSMRQIDYGNYSYSLTENQRDAYSLFVNGNNVSVFLRTDKLNVEGVNLPKGSNIASKIESIKIIPNKPKKQ